VEEADEVRSKPMSTITPTQPTSSLSPPSAPTKRRITVDEYERIIPAGLLKDAEKLELIDGEMVTKMAKSTEHKWTTKATLKALDSRLPAGWTTQKEEAVRIPPYDEPEPDIAIIRGSDDDYKYRNPDPVDVAMLVEIAYSSLIEDRKQGTKYASAGIPIYWIINLVDRQVEVYTDPGPTGYQTRVDFHPGQAVPVVIDGQQCGQIAVDDILP
jgi:Uma2 family endonuclease